MTRLALCLVLIAGTVAVTFAGGCSVGAVSTSGPIAFATVDAAYTVSRSDSGEESDAAAADGMGAALTEGSPLCKASHAAGCYPDDPGTAQTCGLAPDGGVFDPDAGYDDDVLGCHVEPMNESDVVESKCTPAGTGGDGAACQQSQDCAAGYECVGNGVCRHYCCAGNSACTQKQFCDIQPMATASTTAVPVCMPIGRCDLLLQGSCPQEETCAIVRDDGTTSCVAIGSAKAGASCDTQHCGVDLVCLGTPDQRHCYQLCHTATGSRVLVDRDSGLQRELAALPRSDHRHLRVNRSARRSRVP